MAAPIAVIVTNTTTATKTEGCGSQSFSAFTTTLGVGLRCEHGYAWKITAYPAGFEYEVPDPRPGAQLGTTINMRDGDARGQTFAFSMDVAGSYTVQLIVTGADGVASTAVTSMVTVASASGLTQRYMDGGASGLNDGTSPTNAWETADLAGSGLVAIGSDVVLNVAGGQTYSPTVNADMGDNDANWRIIWDDTGTKPIIDKTAGNWFRFRNENVTFDGFVVIDSLLDDIRNAINIRQFVEDIVIRNCSTVSGKKLKSFTEFSPTQTTRMLFISNDTSNGLVKNYSGAFGDINQLDVVGGHYGSSVDERCFRLTADAHASFNGVKMTGTNKFLLRFQDGSNHTVERCYITKNTGGVAGGCVSLGLNSGLPETVRLSRNYFQTADASCIRHQIGTAAGNENLCVVSTYMEVTAGTGSCIDTNEVTLNLKTIIVANCTMVSASTGSFPMLQDKSTVGVRINCNIVQYTGTATSNDFMILFEDSGPTVDITDNVYILGNLTTTLRYSAVSAGDKNLTDFNVITGVSGQTEAVRTIDSNLLPSATDASTNVNSVVEDYYGNKLVPTEAGISGSVQALPPDISTLTPADGATGVSGSLSSLLIVFDKTMVIGIAGDFTFFDASDDSVVGVVPFGDVLINAGDKTKVTIPFTFSVENKSIYIQASTSILKSLVSGSPWGGISNKTDWNFAVGNGPKGSSAVRYYYYGK